MAVETTSIAKSIASTVKALSAAADAAVAATAASLEAAAAVETAVTKAKAAAKAAAAALLLADSKSPSSSVSAAAAASSSASGVSSWPAREDDWLTLLVCQNNTVPPPGKPLGWDAISQYLCTELKCDRSASECEKHWVEVLYPQLLKVVLAKKYSTDLKWSVRDDHCLITVLYETGATVPEEVDDIAWICICHSRWPRSVVEARLDVLREKALCKWQSWDTTIGTLYDNMQADLKRASMSDEVHSGKYKLPPRVPAPASAASSSSRVASSASAPKHRTGNDSSQPTKKSKSS